MARPDVPEQADSWGLAGEKIEEIQLDTGHAYLAALRAAIQEPLETPTTLDYSGESFNRIDYPTNHVLPFLVDSIASYPRDTVLGWSGTKKSLLQGFARAWLDLGFTQSIRVDAETRALGPDLPQGCTWTTRDELCAECSIFVFDWGRNEDGDPQEVWSFDTDPAVRNVMRAFRTVVRHERERLAAEPVHRRRFIGVNSINNSVEGVFNNHIGAALTPMATHIRQGFLTDLRDSDILAMLYAGQAGQKLPAGIVAIPNSEGYVFYGPYLDLDSRTYRLTLEIADVRYLMSNSGPVALEVVSNSRLITYREISRDVLSSGIVPLDFFISTQISEAADWPRIEFRLRTPGGIAMTVRKATLEEIEESPNASAREFDCAPFLMVGRAGVRDGRVINARAGVADLLSYGPYFWLPEGHYEATFRFDINAPVAGESIRAYVASNLGRRVLGRAYVTPTRTGSSECTVRFSIGAEVPPPETGLLEFQVRSGGKIGFALTSVSVKHIDSLPAELPEREFAENDVLPHLQPGPAGAKVTGAILSLSDSIGMVFSGDGIPLGDCRRVTLKFGASCTAETRGLESGLAIAAIGPRGIHGYHEITMDEVREGTSILEIDDGVEIGTLRMRSTGLLEAEISSVAVDPHEGSKSADSSSESNFIKLLEIGRAGQWAIANSGNRSIIRSVLGIADVIAYGPYISLEPGHYDVTFELDVDAGLSVKPIALDVSCDLGRQILARDTIWPFKSGAAKRTLSFVIPDRATNGANVCEFRIWAPGRINFALTGIFMEQRSLIAAR